jgi:anti-sigma B factor antagonist
MDVIETDSGITHVVLDGRFDIAGAEDVDLRFSVLAGSREKIVVDLTNVSFLASMGVRTLMVSARTAHRRGASMAVCSAEENVEKVLRATGFDEVVQIYPDYPAAAAALSS